LFPFRVLRKPILSWPAPHTWATVTFLWWAMLYRDGYSSAKGFSPSQVSSQNLVLSPFPTTKDPRCKHQRYTLEKIRISQARLGVRYQEEKNSTGTGRRTDGRIDLDAAPIEWSRWVGAGEFDGARFRRRWRKPQAVAEGGAWFGEFDGANT
jgi:hypothetical protein